MNMTKQEWDITAAQEKQEKLQKFDERMKKIGGYDTGLLRPLNVPQHQAVPVNVAYARHSQQN